MFFLGGGDKNTQQYSRTTHCNYLLFELKVLTTILLPFYFITASARNFVYPLKNYTGELYCYVYEYSLLYGLVVYQHLSLFINLFRYICIVHGNTLMSHGISMKVSTYTLSRKKRVVLKFCHRSLVNIDQDHGIHAVIFRVGFYFLHTVSACIQLHY